MKLDVAKAIARVERREALRSAEQNAQWVIRKRKLIRLRSKNEVEAKQGDSLTCLHGNSYTTKCTKCKRDSVEAAQHLNRLKALLSIT